MLRLIGLSVLLVTAAACDSASLVSITTDAETSTGDSASSRSLLALDIPVDGAAAGDFVYHLGRLRDGDPFRASLDFADGGGVDVVGVGSPGGVKLGLSTLNGMSPASVTIDYLSNGESIGPRVRSQSLNDKMYPAGLADREPDSYHFEMIGGEITVVIDYNGENLTANPSQGATISTVWGERREVTDVVFTLTGVDPGPPLDVRLSAPVDLDLKWFDLER